MARASRVVTTGIGLGLVVFLILGCAGGRRHRAQTAPSAPPATGAAVPAAAGASVPTERRLTVGGLQREYWVYVPRGYSRDRAVPVLLVFHGGGQNPDKFWGVSGLNQTAEEFNFIAVYPAGTGALGRVLTWNAGACCAYAQRNNIDDVGFAAAVLDAVKREWSVDAQRIYVTGASNGGMMAQRVACELADRITAVVSVAGPLVAPSCSPKRPVPLLEIHGTADENVPYGGGTGSGLMKMNYPSIRQVMSDWARRDGCERAAPVKSAKPGLVWEAWGPCRDGSDVVLATREGGKHEWLPAENRVIWEFLSRFSRR